MVITTVLDTVAVLIVIMEAYAAKDMVAVHDPEVLTARLHVLGTAPRSLFLLIEGIVVNGTGHQGVNQDVGVIAVLSRPLLRQTSSP